MKLARGLYINSLLRCERVLKLLTIISVFLFVSYGLYGQNLEKDCTPQLREMSNQSQIELTNELLEPIFDLSSPTYAYLYDYFLKKMGFDSLKYYYKIQENCTISISEKTNHQLLWRINDTLNISNINNVFSVEICSTGDSVDLHQIFDYLSGLPNLKYVLLTIYSNFYIPRNIASLKQIEGLSICFEPGGYPDFNIYGNLNTDLEKKYLSNKPIYDKIKYNFSIDTIIGELRNLKCFTFYSWSNLILNNNLFNKLNNLKYLAIVCDSLIPASDNVFLNSKIANLFLLNKYPLYLKYKPWYRKHGFYIKKRIFFKNREFEKYTLKSIPEYIFNISGTLENFDYNNILLSKIDADSIAKFKQLRRLNCIMFHNFKKLPFAIDSLNNIEELLIYTDRKKFVQDGQLQKLNELKTIYFEGKSYNKNIGSVPSLTNLLIYNCKINLGDLSYLSSSVKHLSLHNVNLRNSFVALQNHHFEKIFLDGNDILNITKEVFLMIDADTLVIQPINYYEKAYKGKYKNYWGSIDENNHREINNLKKQSRIKVITIKSWH